MAPSILDTVCDELNSALDDAEEVFASRFRVASEVPMAECFLRFAKQGKDYGFFLVSKDGHFPLSSVSLEWRILAANNLDALWSACEVAQGETIQRIKKATETARAFTRTVPPKPV